MKQISILSVLSLSIASLAFTSSAIASKKCCLDAEGKRTDVIATSGCTNGTGKCIGKSEIDKKTKETGKGVQKGMDKTYGIK